MQTIHDRINILLRDLKIKKSEFAKRLNLSQAFISQLCSGAAKPSDRTIIDICEKYSINEAWLRSGEGDMIAQCTHTQKLNRFFADVLSSAPDARSAFVAALDDLPEEFWPMVADLAENYVRNIMEKGNPPKKED